MVRYDVICLRHQFKALQHRWRIWVMSHEIILGINEIL
jgi:hypothetical protein